MLSQSEVRGSHLPKSKILTTVERAPAVLKVRTSRFYAGKICSQGLVGIELYVSARSAGKIGSSALNRLVLPAAARPMDRRRLAIRVANLLRFVIFRTYQYWVEFAVKQDTDHQVERFVEI